MAQYAVSACTSRVHHDGSLGEFLELRDVQFVVVLDLRTTASQKCVTVHRLLHHSTLGSRMIKKKKTGNLVAPYTLSALPHECDCTPP